MGYGTTLTPLLLLAGFEPLQVVPCILLSEFAAGLSAAFMHHRDGNVDFWRDRKARSAAVSLSLLSVIGAIAAVFFAISIPVVWLKATIAIVICFSGVAVLATRRRKRPCRLRNLVVVGMVAAFNKGMSGGGYGPLVTSGQMVSGLSPRKAVAITSLCESLTCAVGLIAYLVLRGSIEWALALPLTMGAMLSIPMATMTVKKVPEKALQGTVGIATCLLGVLSLVRLIW